ETLDSALARTPVARYQSAAKFAHEVASVTGLARRSSPTAIPLTRGDVEDRTRLLDSRAVAALSMPRRTPVPPVKRRSLVPVIVGAGLVLGAGGAAMMVFGRAHRADRAARLDTMRGVPPPVAADSASRAVPPPPPAPPRAPDARPPRRPSGRAAGATPPGPPPSSPAPPSPPPPRPAA